MEFERYYIDLFEMLNSLCKKIASGKYDQADVDKLFNMAEDIGLAETIDMEMEIISL